MLYRIPLFRREKLNFEDVGLSGTLIASVHHDLILKFNKGQIISSPTKDQHVLREYLWGAADVSYLIQLEKTVVSK